MSKDALNNLRDYIQLTLSPSDTRWLINEFIPHSCEQEETLKPYTIEELHERIAQSERDFAEGRYRDIDELFREWDEEEGIEYAAEAEAVIPECHFDAF